MLNIHQFVLILKVLYTIPFLTIYIFLPQMLFKQAPSSRCFYLTNEWNP